MHRKEDSHQDMHRDDHSTIVKVGFRLQCVHTDENDREHVVDDAMVDGAYATPERAEREVFLSGPDFVDAVRILDLLLLHSMLVELRRDLVPVNVTEQLHIIQEGHEVGTA